MNDTPITVIGNGFSALSLAQALARHGCPVRVIGPATFAGRGVAYGAARPEHLLNVPADRMGLDADAPGDFADWLGLEGDARRAFLPRARFGDYLQTHWQALAGNTGTAEVIAQHATGLQRGGDGWTITLADGRVHQAHQVVLALGNAGIDAPAPPAGVIRDPWAPGALDAIPADATVLVLGSGLTMIDIASSLLLRGHRGGITALSRRGLLPGLHPEPPLPPQPPAEALLQALAAQQLSRALRLFRGAVDAGASPAALADGLRPQVAAIWRGLAPATRSRFLRHLRPWWDRVRHRVPAQVMARLDAAAAERLFSLRAGRLVARRAGIADIRPRGAGSREHVRADWLVDATGWDGDSGRFHAHPLLHGLIDAGLARPDALGLGLACDPQGQLLGHDGPVAGLHLLGNLRRGECWESSAVPELRTQAAALAGRLAAGWGLSFCGATSGR